MIEPIGILTFAICVVSFYTPLNFAIMNFGFLTLLGAASAISLGGSGTIPPVHIYLAVLTILTAKKYRFKYELILISKFPEPASWLMFFVLYGIVCAALMPRIFADATIIISVGSTKFGGNGPIPIPLTPTSGNINQSVYLISDLLCFMVFSIICLERGNFIFVGRSFLVVSFLNIFFAAIDFLTSVTSTAFLMDPLRNADYDMHIEETIGGLRRIVGSFTETSSFSYCTIGLLGYTSILAFKGRWFVWSSISSLISLTLLLLSTSGTAYLALLPLLCAVYFYSLSQMISRRAELAMSIVVTLAPLALVVAILYILIDDDLFNSLNNMLDLLIFSKSQSDSGLERAEWNRVGMMNFYATYGIGNGFGTTRVSGWMIAILASTGIPGALLMTGFLWKCFYVERNAVTVIDDIKLAARFGCLGYLLAASVSGSLIDLRFQFFVFAALATSKVR